MQTNGLMKILHRTLENPHIFNAVVSLFGVGGRGKALHGFLGRIIAQEATETILEIGCGTGQFQKHFLNTANFYVAIDINLEYLNHCLRIDHRPHFALSTSVCLPFKSQMFNTVFALFMLHHLSDDEMLRTLREIKRCLKPNGKLILVEPFRDQRKWDWFGKFLVRFDRGRWIRHRNKFEHMLRQAGFPEFVEGKLPRSWPYDISVYKVR
ncbi:MAG TPA: class I SAM-dependent methyltransferase [Thermodesulfobacteriota bacterium]|nr:class I SAM-dependent methyltransferase [Thermodesulfobacteriota bacterium]